MSIDAFEAHGAHVDSDAERVAFLEARNSCSQTKQALADICDEHWTRHAFIEQIAPSEVSDDEAVAKVIDKLMEQYDPDQVKQIFVAHGL